MKCGIFRNHPACCGALVAICLTVGACNDSPRRADAAAAPTSPERTQSSTAEDALVAALRRAYAECDEARFLESFYTGVTAAGRDLSVQRGVFAMECGRSIARIILAAIPHDAVTTYAHDGVWYRPTLPPSARLVVEFESPDDGLMQRETTSFLVGEADGRRWLLTAEPAPPAAP